MKEAAWPHRYDAVPIFDVVVSASIGRNPLPEKREGLCLGTSVSCRTTPGGIRVSKSLIEGRPGDRDDDSSDLKVEEQQGMTTRISHSTKAILMATLTGALMTLPPVSLAAGRNSAGAAAAQDQPDAMNAAKSKLNKSQFKNVQVTVDSNGIATLTGTVDLYEHKADAEKRVSKVKGVTAVRNQIEVSGPTVSDQELQSKLGEKLAYDRVGYGTTAFNAISIGVQNGVVTLGGHAYGYVDRDSALALVSTYPGVKDVVNEIEVDPTSIMDDQTRLQVARAIYGYPSLNKYAVDPAKPIRISVQNGHVELYGTVDSQADKDTAFLRANGVSGVFGVKNYLQVAGQPAETSRK
jgi:osmotically-inducible protein OsmY